MAILQHIQKDFSSENCYDTPQNKEMDCYKGMSNAELGKKLWVRRVLKCSVFSWILYKIRHNFVQLGSTEVLCFYGKEENLPIFVDHFTVLLQVLYHNKRQFNQKLSQLFEW